jgi:Zn finger protein HypA/HybF involved in hydrogenase expression
MTYSTVQKDLKCSDCGTVFPIHRKVQKNHSTGHKKHLYCFKCQRETAHIELGKEGVYHFDPIYRIEKQYFKVGDMYI